MDKESVELSLIRETLAGSIKAAAAQQKEEGRGVLLWIVGNNPKDFRIYWRKPETLPQDPAILHLASLADFNRLVITIIIIYPGRVAAYAISLATSPALREKSGLPFVVLGQAIRESDGDMQQSSGPILRAGDLEKDESFL